MEKKIIKKVMAIGANCYGADFTNALGVREKGPVDNIADFNIWKSPTLFNNQFKKFVGASPQNYRKLWVGNEQFKNLNHIYNSLMNN